ALHLCANGCGLSQIFCFDTGFFGLQSIARRAQPLLVGGKESAAAAALDQPLLYFVALRLAGLRRLYGAGRKWSICCPRVAFGTRKLIVARLLAGARRASPRA